MQLNYRDFLKLPEIKSAFNDMFEKQKDRFMQEALGDKGFGKEQLEVTSIKMSFIATDMYFTEMHKNRDLKTGR